MGTRDAIGAAPEPVPIGRGRELRLLDAALHDALSGRGRVITVFGEAGIGKTTVVESVTADARRRGAAVAWGRCWEGGGAPAFWPWTQVARELAALDDPPPGVEPVLGSAGRGASDTPQTRFALFDAMASWMRRVAEGRPLVVALEDLHAADVPSLHLLEFAARSIRDAPVLLLASFREVEARTREDAGPILTSVVELGMPIRLRGLDAEALGELAGRRLGRTPDARTVERLAEVTEGNPFYLDEMLRAVGGIDGPVPLPHGVRETIRRRLEPLSPEARDLLVLAAVVGREFRLRTLEQAAGRPRLELLELLDEAREASIVARDRAELGRYRFAHVLFREALYDDLSDTERVELHGRVGRALEEVYGTTVDRHLPELAHHFLEEARGGGGERALDYARRAGRRALEQLAYEDAVRHYRSALDALELAAGEETERAELLLELGAARMRAGDIDGARGAFIEASEVADALGSGEQLARAALGLGVWGMSPRTDHVLIDVLELALARLDPALRPLRARLLARLASALYWTPERDRRVALAEEATALAREDPDDPRTLGFVLTHANIATWGPDTLEERAQATTELFALAESLQDPELLLHALLFRIPEMLERGDGPAVRQQIAGLERLVGRLHQPRIQWLVPAHGALLAAIEGHWEEFEQLTQRVLEEQIEGTVAPVTSFISRFATAWVRGTALELEGELTRWTELHPGQPTWHCLRCLLHAQGGRDARARSILELHSATDYADIPRDAAWLASLAALGEAAHHLGDADRARELLALIEPFADRHVVAAQGVYLGPASRFCALLALTTGDAQTALRHSTAARREVERMNAPPFLVSIALGEMEAYAVRDAPGDAARAARAREEALRTSIELDLPAVTERLRGAPVREPVPVAGAAVLRRLGDTWSFELEGRAVTVRDSKGMGHLATLLAHPGADIHALDLAGGGSAVLAGAVAAATDAGLSIGAESSGPTLDDAAKSAYRSRIEDLRAEIDEAESFNDPERASRAQAELEFIATELASAVGLGGRDRRTGSNAERARVNVTRAIKTTIRRVAELDEGLGAELDATISTGTFCRYTPDPRRPLRWEIEA